MGGVIAKVSRKKLLEHVTPDTSLRRCLTTFDLTLMGMGSMIGSGIYVMTGQVIKEQAGPGIVLSFIFAAVIILMVAGCFTEFAARVHRTGSTYLYVYLSLGELPAFLLGFITICLCIMGGATNARAWSAYMDSLFNGTISNFTRSNLAEWNIGPPIAEYPDFVALALVVFMTLIVALGAKCASWFNTLFALVNVLILSFVIVVGFLYADLTNWTSAAHGGFMPYGFSGVMKGSAVCFWAFSGFEILSCAVEEARNPKRDLPIATVISLLVVMVLYVGTTASLTIMTPYYDIETDAPLPSAFAAKGLYWAQLVVSIGPLCGLTTTLMSSLYSFVRIAYKISEDGLLFEFLSHVNNCSQVPVYSVLVCGTLMSIVALSLDLSELISFAVIMILLSYCLVCGGVIILRYQPQETRTTSSSTTSTYSINDDSASQSDHLNTTQEPAHGDCDEVFNSLDPENDTTDLIDKQTLNGGHVENIHSNNNVTHRNMPKNDRNDNITGSEKLVRALEDFDGVSIRDLENGGDVKNGCTWLWPCNKLSPGRWPCVSIFIMAALALVAAVVMVYYGDTLLHGDWWAIILFTVSLVMIPLILATIYAHHQNLKGLTVKMPCVPFVPVFSMCTCVYLLVSTATVSNWIGLSILLTIGLIIYFSYSIRHSKLNLLSYQALPIDSLEGATVTLLDHMTSEEEEENEDEF